MRVAAAVVLAALGSIPAYGQEAGDNLLAAGWIHIHPLDQGGEIRTHLRSSLAGTALGIPETFDSPGTALSADNNDTPGLTVAHFFTRNWGVEFDVGVPPVMQVRGHGVVSPPGASGLLFNVDLGDPTVNPLGSGRQWSPALMLQWRAGNDARWWPRPYLGAGFTFTWFTHVKPSEAFAEAVDRRMGSVLAAAAGKPGATSLSADIDAAFAPVVNGGLSFALSRRWGVQVGIAYVLLSTQATLDIRADDGTLLARTHSNVDVDALVTGILLTYTL